ncbi:ZN414 protein, partial [Picathartes gymnocephalus]|nr:ZN414 protein [Picathartes gymnocephalus]
SAARAARLAGAAAAGVTGPPPLPAAGARPLRAVVLDSVLGATPVLGAGAVPALRAPLALRAGAAPGSAPPAALPARPRPPQRLQRRLEEKPRAPAPIAPRHQPAPGDHGADPGGHPGAIPVLPCPPVLAGHSSNSRIVWEHTRGRYSCTQCPFSTASREEMTLHIEDHRKNPPPGRLEAEMDFGVGLAPFHAKLPPEMENSLYSQL